MLPRQGDERRTYRFGEEIGYATVEFAFVGANDPWEIDLYRRADYSSVKAARLACAYWLGAAKYAYRGSPRSRAAKEQAQLRWPDAK